MSDDHPIELTWAYDPNVDPIPPAHKNTIVFRMEVPPSGRWFDPWADIDWDEVRRLDAIGPYHRPDRRDQWTAERGQRALRHSSGRPAGPVLWRART
jgi:hypothetical protein